MVTYDIKCAGNCGTVIGTVSFEDDRAYPGDGSYGIYCNMQTCTDKMPKIKSQEEVISELKARIDELENPA